MKVFKLPLNLCSDWVKISSGNKCALPSLGLAPPAHCYKGGGVSWCSIALYNEGVRKGSEDEEEGRGCGIA